MITPPRALSFILALYVALALFYNWASPPFENSDEFFHFPLVKHLADTGGSLPVQVPADQRDWRQQGNQPPLYHLMAAALISPMNTDDYPQARRVNPHARLGVAGESNLNAVIHPLDRGQEWQSGTALALRLTRLFSTLLGGIVVISAYALTRYSFPTASPWAGVLAAALVAFNPMFLFVASSVNNDNLSNAMISLILATLVWLYRREGRPPRWAFVLMGVCLGFSLLSKLSTGPFMFLVGLAWLVIAEKNRAWGYMFKWGVFTLGLALLISAWWYLRNYQLYGDFTGLNRFLEVAGRRAIPLTAEQLWSEREGFMQSFWGLFGALTVPMAGGVYRGFNFWAGLSLLGLGLWLYRCWGEGESSPLGRLKAQFPLFLLLLWLLLSMIGLIRWTALTWASQGRLWFIALTSLAALSAVGFMELSRRARWEPLAALPALYALGVAIAAPLLWIIPAYAPPDFIPPAPDEAPVLIFYENPDSTGRALEVMAADFPAEIRSGERPRFRARFCTPEGLERDWSVFLHLVDSTGIILAQADFTPGGGALATSEVPAGACWDEVYPLEIRAGLSASDQDLQVLLGFYQVSTGARMASESAGVGNTRLMAGDELAKFSLGGAARLESFQISAGALRPGERLQVDLLWEAVGDFAGDYTVFVQVLEPRTGYRAGASDQGPRPPTSQWRAGQTIPDRHFLTIDPAAPPGPYVLIVGFYLQPEPGVFERLRLSYEGVDTGFDYLQLVPLKIN